MTMINDILEIQKDKSVMWKHGKTKKTAIQEIIAALDGLVAGRCYLPSNIKINEILGIPEYYQVSKGHKQGLSYAQMQTYIRYIAKNRKLLKRPYKLPDYIA